MQTIPYEEVARVRRQITEANALAAQRFQGAFAAQSDVPPNERWRVHLDIQAAALFEAARGVRGRVTYDFVGHVVVPTFSEVSIDPEPAAIFEWWMLTSEINASSAWRTTKVIASREEYDEALRRMDQPQLVRALIVSFLPAADVERSFLEVTLYTRADEERVERRQLRLDDKHEFHFHGRELIAEGRGGVTLS